ncbi:MAG: DUF348 domain-containing protein [Ruminococcaceae bacterium]|nr:DUF348 domain-containing protein [Oscillospiraceae bacterium]
MSFLKKASTTRAFYLILICITVAILAAVILFGLAFINAEEEVPADPAPFSLRSGVAEVISDFNFRVTLSYHGASREVIVNKYTVEQLLKKEGIVLEEQDVINVDLHAELTPDMFICIDKVRFETEYEEIVLPFNRVVEASGDVPERTNVTIAKGESGLRKDTYSTKFVNDVPVERKLVFRAITKTPVDEVIRCGTMAKQPSAVVTTNTAGAGVGSVQGTSAGGVFTAPDGTEYKYRYYVDVKATAYSDNVGDITYTGRHVELGIIAVDPRVIPLHSKVYVIGDYGDYGICDAQDIGGGIKGNRIDVYLKYEDVCRQFGVRQMRAYVLDVPEKAK